MSITLHSLRPNEGAVRNKKRLGRGHGSGLHKTSGKGQKGQKARTGHHGIPKPGFEGGQTAMARRLPKRGFTNHMFKKRIEVVNLGDVLERIDAGTVTVELLKEQGLIPRAAELVKILGEGEVGRAVTIAAHFFSESAKEKLEKAGGKAEIVAVPANKPEAPPQKHKSKKDRS